MEKRVPVKFNPGIDTAIAALTVPLMMGIYYLNTTYGYEYPIVFFGGFVLLGHIVLNTLIPLFTVLVLRKEDLAGLGITQRGIKLSLVLSLGLAALMYPQLTQLIKGSGADPAPNVAYNAIALWEPLFVYGWLQMRFERAFGYLFAPVLAGASFALYHLGTFPPADILVLFVSGIVYGGLFAITRNLLVLLPMTWAVGSTIGTLSGGFSFDWLTVAIYLGVLGAQIGLIYSVKKYAHRPTAPNKLHSGHAAS